MVSRYRLVIGISVAGAVLLSLLWLVLCYIKLFWIKRSTDDFPEYPGGLDDNFPGDSVDLPGEHKDVVLQVQRKEKYTVGERTEHSTGVVRDRKPANRRGTEGGVGTYLNKVLRALFTVFGLLTIILSVVLDNSFNEQPERFIPFGILAPCTIFFGFMASGWFPRIPLRFIAFLKRHGFLRHVKPCSPWHDNVLTDFCGMICTLNPIEQVEGTSQLLPVLQMFLYGDLEAELEPESSDFQEASTLELESQDLGIQDSEDVSGTTKCPPTVMTRGQAPSQVEETVVQIDYSSMFSVSDDGCILTFQGPPIKGFPLEVQAFKNALLRDSFDLSCTFRNKKTRRMYLNTRGLKNLAQNMLRWVDNPHPIVVEETSDILHCMSIQDILWAFTKTLYRLESLQVQHRFPGCLSWEGVKQYALITFIAVTSLSGLIPLISDVRSLYFLVLVVPIVAYIIISVTGHLITYYFKSLLCPIFIKVRGFNKLYKCRSFFIWCNEFRKQRVVNPAYFLIDQEYANSIFEDGESCFNIYGSVEIPDSPAKDQSPITLVCHGWPAEPSKCKKQHDYKLVVKFDRVQDGCYIDVRLSFYENDDLLDNRYFYGSTKVERLHLVEKLFCFYSDPSFGGYVESIRPSFRSYLGHCPRFLEVCKKIISEDTTPTLLIAARKPDSKLIIGDSFLSVTPSVV